MASSSGKEGLLQYEDGDITIVISTSRIYKLHSHDLRRVSDYFRDMFETTKPPRLTPAARRAGLTPWRFQLFEDPSVGNAYGTFVSLPVSESGRIRDNIPPRAARLTVGGEDKDICWDWLFGCLHGIPPEFDSSSFAATAENCFILIAVADTIGAVKHVREVVDLELMRQDEVLWKSIASNPIIWAELGRRIQSPTIFKESVIHIVGKWKMLSVGQKEQLPKDIQTLCAKKWEELEVQKRAIEIRIAGHYPPFLRRDHADKPNRTAYASDIYSWMALSYFRQYIAQAGNDGRNRLADDGGYKWYQQFASGGDAYLHHEDMAEFHALFPMSSKACGVMAAHMNVLKEDVKDFVKDLVSVRTHIDPAMLEGVTKPWLTCTVVERNDLPWVVQEEREDSGLGMQIGEIEMEVDDEEI